MHLGADTVVSPTKVLVAEDSPIFQSMLKHLLEKWGYEVVVADNGEEAWAHLQPGDGPRLAILDWMMPGMDGVEVCRRIRDSRREPYTYVLLLTARAESRYLVEGMEAGADDYLTKPFNAHELRVRLRAGRRVLDLQSELVKAREALRRQATHDGLTGVSNRTGILDILHRELARAVRENTPVAVLLADLDHFKQINDTHGHLAGDEVLRQAACRMQSQLRRYDSIGRYGGEEFLVVLPGCAGEGVAAQGERLRSCFDHQPFQVADDAFNVTCSVGAAWTRLPEESQGETLVRAADETLYLAKGRGRNRVEVACLEAEAATTGP